MIIARQVGTWAIRAVHAAFIFYIVVSPYWYKSLPPTDPSDPFLSYFGYSSYDVIYLSFCATLLIHWYLHSDVCFLTRMEELVSGQSYQKGFIHRLVSPIYNLPKQGDLINFISYAVVLVNAMHVLFYNRK